MQARNFATYGSIVTVAVLGSLLAAPVAATAKPQIAPAVSWSVLRGMSTCANDTSLTIAVRPRTTEDGYRSVIRVRGVADGKVKRYVVKQIGTDDSGRQSRHVQMTSSGGTASATATFNRSLPGASFLVTEDNGIHPECSVYIAKDRYLLVLGGPSAKRNLAVSARSLRSTNRTEVESFIGIVAAKGAWQVDTAKAFGSARWTFSRIEQGNGDDPLQRIDRMPGSNFDAVSLHAIAPSGQTFAVSASVELDD